MYFFFKQKTAYEMRISDWSSDVCSSDLNRFVRRAKFGGGCLRKSGHIARTLDAGHLHAKTNAKEGHIAFTSKFHAGNLAIAAPLAKTARHQYAVHRLQLLDQMVFIFKHFRDRKSVV